MNNYLETLSNIGIVPVIKIDDINDALPLAKALIDGGLPCAEVTFRTKHAKQAIELITKAFPTMLVGAGTVITTDQVDDALSAGAKFIVSPGLNPKIVAYCIEKNVLIIPGCANASDIECALEFGLNTVKFFPAEALGGLEMLKALRGPYTQVSFMPTGGITETTITNYLKEEFIVACGGTWMVDTKLIARKDYTGIQTLTNQAVLSMLDLSLHHIGINPLKNPNQLADEFTSLFRQEKNELTNSIFASQFIEIMKQPTGTFGHIAIGTKSVKRAKYYFESLGYSFLEATKRYNDKQQLTSVYFEKELNGLAIHLVQK